MKALLYLDESSPGLAEHTQEGLDLLENWLKGERSPKVKTVSDAVTAFIARQKARVIGNMMSAGHFDIMARCAEYFRDFVGKATGLHKINGQTLEDYHIHLPQQDRRRLVTQLCQEIPHRGQALYTLGMVE